MYLWCHRASSAFNHSVHGRWGVRCRTMFPFFFVHGTCEGRAAASTLPKLHIVTTTWTHTLWLCHTNFHFLMGQAQCTMQTRILPLGSHPHLALHISIRCQDSVWGGKGGGGFLGCGRSSSQSLACLQGYDGLCL